MSNALAYSIKVWITSVILGSFISTLPTIYHSNSAEELTQSLGMILFIMGIAAVLSFCSWLLLFVFTYLFTKQHFEVTKVKFILSCIGLILALAPLLWIAHGGLGLISITDLFSYPLIIIAAIWSYKLEPGYSDESTAQVKR